MFRLPAIAARHLGIVELDGLPVAPDEMISPCVCVLPMGWSWALHVCQSVLRHALVSEGVDATNTIEDGLPAVSLQRASDTAGAGYVDNLMILGSDPAAVQDGLDRVCRILESLGLSVHELSPASREVSFVGLEFTNVSTISVKAKNLCRLRFGIEALLRRGVCSGSALQ
eukprot:2701175-Pyramimonas_sp.AAC.1